MPKHSRKPPSDPILAAKSILGQITGESDRVVPGSKDRLLSPWGVVEA
ncbi:MAG: hypothetical protein ACYDG0_03935 [Vulcanimicrobiaceae bacterium]